VKPGRVIVKKGNTAENVAAALRRAILHGELAVGEHVRQEVWAQRLGVSRAPTREAMKMLLIERLLTYDTHRGYFVTQLNTQEMAQVYLVRRILEAEVLRTVRWPTAEELAMLHKIAEQTIELWKSNDIHSAMDSARALQFAIFDLSPLEFLTDEVKRYWGLADVYRALSMSASRASDPNAELLARHHVEIFTALETHDHELLIEHNSRWRNAVVAQVGGAGLTARQSVDTRHTIDDEG